MDPATECQSTHPLVRVLEKDLFSNDWGDVTGHAVVGSICILARVSYARLDQRLFLSECQQQGDSPTTPSNTAAV